MYTQTIFFLNFLFSFVTVLHVFLKMHDPVVQYSALLLLLFSLLFPSVAPDHGHVSFVCPSYSCGLYFSGSINYSWHSRYLWCLFMCGFQTSPCELFFPLAPSTYLLVSGLFHVAVLLMMSLLFLNIATGFEMGGGEAVSAQNQPGTPREGWLRCIFFPGVTIWLCRRQTQYVMVQHRLC